MITMIERSLAVLTRLLDREAKREQLKHERCLAALDAEEVAYRKRFSEIAAAHAAKRNALVSENAAHVARCAKADRLASKIKQLTEV